MFWSSSIRSVAAIRREAAELHEWSDSKLLERARSLAFRARSGQALSGCLTAAYALVAEAFRRELGIAHYEEQLIGGIHLGQRCVIQMETGEGKTFTAPLPLFLYALQGEGAHLATSNDYLAARDAEMLRPVFERLGMTVGVITSDLDDEDRASQYSCDITYGTMTEFGFDFLRDRMKKRATQRGGVQLKPVMRKLYYVLADEADSLMIDDANTPLIIGVERKTSQEDSSLYQWANAVARQARFKEHYTYRLHNRRVELTREGRRCVRASARSAGLLGQNNFRLFEAAERAILVDRDFQRDRHYIVRDGELALVTESTGRVGEGRQWQNGIQQALQARERLEISTPSTHSSKISMQAFFLSYQHIAGMTGTAVSAKRELRKVYKARVVEIPPHLKNIRKRLPTMTFRSASVKWLAICDEIAEMRAVNRPVLVGTRSVERSEQLSTLLSERGIPHKVLNARQHQQEAEIITAAGSARAVTVATGMAGRGTDIKLSAEAESSGGLHVILSEMHDSPRMDRQLIGRCARQGQPGSYRQFVSLDDEVLDLGLGAEAANRIRAQSSQRGTSTIESTLGRARAKIESRQKSSRVTMLYHDEKRLRALWDMGQDPLLDTV